MVDADGKGARDGAAVADAHRAAVLIDLGAMFLAAIVEKAFEPFYRLKADDVIMQHRGEEPLVMRERNEQAGRRPGNVQAQPDAIPHAVRATPLPTRLATIYRHQDAQSEERRVGNESGRTSR